MTLSSAWVQSKIRDASNQPRFLYGTIQQPATDPETLLARISLVKDIETCFYRGLINRRQVYLIEEWLATGIVEDRYSLAAALIAIATISGYEDEAYIKNTERIGLSPEEIRYRLLELSETFTADLEIPIKEEDNPNVMAG